MKEISIVATFDSPVYGFSSTSWAAARNSAVAIGGGNSTGVMYDGSVYQDWRAFLSFDTSLIPRSSKILKVELIMTASIINSNPTAPTSYVIKNDWSAYDPMSEKGFSTPYNNALSSAKDNNHFSDLAVDTPKTVELDKGWVDKGGMTYYTLVNSRSYDNSQPAGQYSVFHFWYRTDAAAARRPQLKITYEPRPLTTIAMLW